MDQHPLLLPQFVSWFFRRGLAILLGAFAATVFFRYLWEPLLPFLLAFLLASLMQKPLNTLDRLTGEKRSLRNVWAAILVFAAVGLVFFVLFVFIDLLIEESVAFFDWLGDNIQTIGAYVGKISTLMEDLFSSVVVPGIDKHMDENIFIKLFSSFDDLLTDMLQKALNTVTSKLPQLFARTVAAFPRILLFIGVFLIASVYLTAEYREIIRFLKKSLSSKHFRLCKGLKRSLLSTVVLYVRAFFILSMITMVILYIGFLILKVEWALGIALLTALVDILPILGTGTVLLPWSVFSFLGGDLVRGIGLLILYVTVCALRQALEPRIVGKNIGLHPLAALCSMYFGIKLFGVIGLFVLPMAVSVYWRYRMKEKGMAS
ncbi:MAG: sporulation integral membrane protein YtvI [Clostridia bacterium]|nr:sporulation integral membrane protein YtvI [Clostridia bacterium]